MPQGALDTAEDDHTPPEFPPEFPTAILLVSVEDLEKSCNDSNIEYLTLFLRERWKDGRPVRIDQEFNYSRPFTPNQSARDLEELTKKYKPRTVRKSPSSINICRCLGFT